MKTKLPAMEDKKLKQDLATLQSKILNKIHSTYRDLINLL